MVRLIRKHRLLVISVDGLSHAQAPSLCQRMVGSLFSSGRLYHLSGSLLSNSQSIWSEILTGSTALAAGCPGYARPVSSLNDLKVVQESDLLSPVNLFHNNDENNIVINVPLLEPSANRTWLSDGSMPVHTVVSPANLLKQQTFANYKPRAFSSSNIALRDVRASVDDCLSTEQDRLKCFSELINQEDWNNCIMRISGFDLLAHLLGNEFLDSKNLVMHSQVENFISSLCASLNNISEKFDDVSVCILSAFSHAPCHATLNLNRLLEMSGYCQIKSQTQSETSEALARRSMASKLIRAGSDSGEVEPMAARTHYIDTSTTVAASPVQGTVYINRQDRFADGIVAPHEVEAVTTKVQAYLQTTLEQEFGSSVVVHKLAGASNGMPDLVVCADAVEMHDSVNRPAFDHINKPRSIHSPHGFVWLPWKMSRSGDSLSPIELNAELINHGR